MANEINGTDLFVWLDGDVIASSTSHTLSFKMATRDTSNKDSGIFNTRGPGRFDVSASCDGLMIYDGAFEVIMNAMRLQVPVTLEFGQKDGATDDLDTAEWYASGDFIITGCDLTAPDQDNATYAATFEHYDGFDFTPHAELRVIEVANVNAATNASEDGMAAVYVSGGVAPYTFAWDVSLETTNPAIALDGAYDSTGITHTVTVTDSTPGTPLEATLEIVIFADAAGA
jgi:hypothetical protein